MSLKTVIADDEPLARERLRSLLSSDPAFDIVKECRNGGELLTALKSDIIDVLFLDVQMPGKGGFEALAQLAPASMPITVFITAHPQYAVRAFEVQALDYLTKPLELNRFKATLGRIKDRIASRSAVVAQQQLRSMLDTLNHGDAPRREYPKRLLVPDGTKDFFINVLEIEWIEAADYYCCLHLKDKNLMLRETIKQLADTLDPEKFVRVHRSVIVNLERVREIVREGRSEGWVVLANGHRLRMSKTGWENLLAASQK